MEGLAVNEFYSCVQGEGKFMGIPHLLIRMNGCPLRCQFSNSFCDTPYTSWYGEKDKPAVTLETLQAFYENYPRIKHTMITGGEPTANKELLKTLVELATSFDHTITIETAGYSYVPIDNNYNITISLSPKLSSSNPIVGTALPWDPSKQVTEQIRARHEKNRTKYRDMALFFLTPERRANQIKIVISQKSDIDEAESFLDRLASTIIDIKSDQGDFKMFEGSAVKGAVDFFKKDYKSKIRSQLNDIVWYMPAGETNAHLDENRKWVLEAAIEKGYKYSDRLHVVVYGPSRGV